MLPSLLKQQMELPPLTVFPPSTLGFFYDRNSWDSLWFGLGPLFLIMFKNIIEDDTGQLKPLLAAHLTYVNDT